MFSLLLVANKPAVGACSASIVNSGLPSFELGNVCDVSNIMSTAAPLQLHDTSDLFPGVQPRGMGSPAAIPKDVADLTR